MKVDTYKYLNLASSYVDKTIRPIVNTFNTYLNDQPSLRPAVPHTATPTQGFRNLQQKGKGHWWVMKKLSWRKMFEYTVVNIGSLNLIWHIKIQSLPFRKHCCLIAETKQLMLFRERVLCLLCLITLAYPLCFIVSSGSERTADYTYTSIYCRLSECFER